MNIAIFGAPGSGKGTQSAKIKQHYGLHHISTGDLLRREIAAGTPLGVTAESYISKGRLIPDDLVISMLEAELDTPEATKGVIFDGFPRTIAQARALKEMLERRGHPLKAVIGLEVEPERLVKRLIQRGAESGRSDDNPVTIAHRMRVYNDTTAPLREFYQGEGLYRPINGDAPIDDIFHAITDQLDPLT